MSAFCALIFWMMRPPNVGCPKTVPDAPAWRTKQRARAARSRRACQFQNVEPVVKEKPDLESGLFGAKPMTVEVAEHLKFVDEHGRANSLSEFSRRRRREASEIAPRL